MVATLDVVNSWNFYLLLHCFRSSLPVNSFAPFCFGSHSPTQYSHLTDEGEEHTWILQSEIPVQAKTELTYVKQ